MVTNRYPRGAIDVYAFRTPSGKEISAAPMKLSSLKCVSLLLPALQPNNQYAEFNSHTSPFTGHVQKGTPFISSEDARIHVLSVTTQPSQPPHSNSDSELAIGPPGRAASFVVIVLNRVMLKYIDKALASSSPGVTEVVWEEWGPRNTRWLPERSSYAWQRSGNLSSRPLAFAWTVRYLTSHLILDTCTAHASFGRCTAPGRAHAAGCRSSTSACTLHAQVRSSTRKTRLWIWLRLPWRARTGLLRDPR